MWAVEKPRHQVQIRSVSKAKPAISAKNKTLRTLKRDIAFPLCTASSWSIVSADSGELLWGKNQDEVRDMASLSKIMTCLLVCQYVNLQLCSLDDVLVVSLRASHMTGTSARLKENDNLRVVDCLHAMMLPSGNDAAKALAEFVGEMLKRSSVNESYSEAFVKRMNLCARQIGLQQTKFSNPHGLAHKGNRSTTRELGIMAAFLLNDPIGKRIVACTEYSCPVTNQGVTRQVSWSNTNLLLSEDCCTGVKTGITSSAGPCLSASYKIGELHLVVTILNCKSANRRWAEAKGLVEWAKLQLMYAKTC